ncbi:MAG: lipopolysaccharide biosynthesis protein [Caulobacteraceae bacterium]
MTRDAGRWRQRTQRLSPYLLSALEQGLWSAMNVGVGLLLIRLAAPVQYGAYAFWANIGFVLASFQNALTVTHLLVLPPGGDAAARRRVEGLMLGITGLFLAATALCVLVLAVALRRAVNPLGAPAAALFVPAFLLQQFARSLAFSRGRPAVAAWQTGAVLALGLALLAIAATHAVPLSADWMLGLLGAAYGVVGAGGLALAARGLELPSWRGLAAYGAYARQSTWIFLGVSTTELLARFYAFVTAGFYGPAALATLSASQLTLRPIPLLATAWSMAGRSDLARRREAGNWSGFVRVVLTALALGLVAAVVWTGLVYEGWGLISRYVFGGKYADAGWMALLWGCSSAFSFGQVAVSVGLQTLRAFKPLALANTIASLVAGVAIVVAIRFWGAAGAIIGTIAGQGVEFAVMSLLLAAHLRTAQSLPAEDPSGA